MISILKTEKDVYVAVLGDEVDGDKTRCSVYNPRTGFVVVGKTSTFKWKIVFDKNDQEAKKIHDDLVNLGYYDDLYYMIYMSEIVPGGPAFPEKQGNLFVVDTNIPFDGNFERSLQNFGGVIVGRKPIRVNKLTDLNNLIYLERYFKRKIKIPEFVPSFMLYHLFLMEIWKRKEKK